MSDAAPIGPPALRDDTLATSLLERGRLAMQGWWRSVVVALAVGLSSGALARAEAPAGALKGVVRTSSGQPVSGFALTLVGPAEHRTVVTGPQGRYAVAGLAPGDYHFEVAEEGFTISPEARATVGGGEASLDVVLGPAPVREHVLVAATRSEAAASTLGTSVTVLDRDAITS